MMADDDVIYVVSHFMRPEVNGGIRSGGHEEMIVIVFALIPVCGVLKPHISLRKTKSEKNDVKKQCQVISDKRIGLTCFQFLTANLWLPPSLKRPQ